MDLIKIRKNQLLNNCKNEIEEELIFQLLFENNVSFKPYETKYGVSKNKTYKFFKSKIDNEYVFIDDENKESLVWIAIDGEFLLNGNEVINDILQKIVLEN